MRIRASAGAIRTAIFAAGFAAVSLACPGAPARAQNSASAPQTTAPKQQKGAGSPKQPAAARNPGTVPNAGQVKREVPLVDVFFSVLNGKNKFITDLGPNDFEVLDNGLPQQIQFFNRQSDLPLRIGILLDTSNSIQQRLQFEQNAAFDFLFRNIRPGQDLAFVMTFDTHPQVQQGFTDNMDLLRQAIFSQRAGGGTALYDAIYTASRQLIDAPLPPHSAEVRRVLVIFSDGIDDLSNDALSTALKMAERVPIEIYTISTNQEWVSPDQFGAQAMPRKLGYTHGDRILQQIADDTGGRPFFPYQVSDLAQAFADIGTELRSQYLIAYTPSYHAEDGKFHYIQIQLLHGKGLTVRARQGYWAPEPSAPSSDPSSH